MKRVQKMSRVTVVVDAAVRDVWRIVADVQRTGEWSHECRSVRWLGGARAAVPGARFRGRNQARWVRWSRTCQIVAVYEPHELIWRTVPSWRYPDSTEWSIRLAADEHRTSTISREAGYTLRQPSFRSRGDA